MTTSVIRAQASVIGPNHGGEHYLSSRSYRRICCLVLLAHCGLVLTGACCDFPTIDEPGHLASGISYWCYGSFQLYSVNPPLAKAIAAAPVVLFMPVDTSMIGLPSRPGARPEFTIGEQFLLSNADQLWTIILVSRLAGLGWSIVGAIVVRRWAAELFGTRAGLLALAVWCFEPNVIAHAHIVGTDLPATVAAIVASYLFWYYLANPTWWAAFASGALLGAALVTKFTLLVLCPVWLGAWMVALFRSGRSGCLIVQLPLVVLGCGLVLNGCYLFQGSFTRLGDYRFVSRLFGGENDSAQYGNRFADHPIGDLPLPLPVDYLGGIDVQRRDFEYFNEERYCYLRGEWSRGVTWYYYLYAAVVKVPLGVCGLTVVAILGIVARARRGNPFGLWFATALGGALFAAVSSQSALSGHVRYALPAFGFWFILIGAACVWATTVRRWWYIGIMLVWQIGSVLPQAPHTMSYFNELAGGPDNGWRHLTGSNIDWGQDVWWVKRWLNRHPHFRDYQLAVFTTVDPGVVGLRGYSLPPPGPTRATIHLPPRILNQFGPQPGNYIVSARFLTGAHGEVRFGQGERAVIARHTLEYFRFFRPVDRIGGVYFAYVISLEEANQVRRRLGMPLLDAH